MRRCASPELDGSWPARLERDPRLASALKAKLWRRKRRRLIVGEEAAAGGIIGTVIPLQVKAGMNQKSESSFSKFAAGPRSHSARIIKTKQGAGIGSHSLLLSSDETRCYHPDGCPPWIGSRVDGLSRNSPASAGRLKSNMLVSVPASASKEPG